MKMDQYDTAAFKEQLEKLTQKACTGTYYEAPMVLPYHELMKALNTGNPIRLYRYYAPTDRNIGDLEMRRVHLSTPEKFDDVLDCQPIFDLPKIRSIMESRITIPGVIDSWKRKRKHAPSSSVSQIDEVTRRSIENFDKTKERVIVEALANMPNQYAQLRSRIGCTCFSECPNSSYMWSKYAASYSGFVASFDIDPIKTRCCCMKPGCASEHAISTSLLFMLSPVLYDGRYDMSELSFEFAGFGNYQPFPSVGQLVTMIHATVHKTSDWSNQREWRLFTWLVEDACPSPCYARLDAKEIIVGPETDSAVQKRLARIAAEKNIPVRHARIDIRTTSNGLIIT